jgi:polar amino acid transport system substrate-binding protein
MSDKPTLTVGVHEFRPLTFKTGKNWSGFEIELWEHVADKLGYTTEYVEEKHFSRLLEETQAGNYDVAIAGITRTAERDENLNMTFFTLDTGLGIAVLPHDTLSIRDMLKGIFSKQTLQLLFLLIGFSFVAANVYWLIERGNSVAPGYFAGIFESFWWGIVTFSTVGYGDISPATLLGKIFGIVSIISGLAIFGLYIGQLSASLTLRKARTTVAHPRDLAGKRIAVKAATTAVQGVEAKKGIPIKFPNLDEALRALREGKVEAVVADLPVLQDLQNRFSFEIAPKTFARQTYAFMMPKGKNEELLQWINHILLQYYETGEYEELYDKYFDT